MRYGMRYSLLLLVLSHDALQARQASPVSLSPVWQMETDNAYTHNADYRPPPPVRGLAMHGYFADDEVSVTSGGKIGVAHGACARPVVMTDPRGLPQDAPLRTHTEFWLFRTTNEGLYLSRRWRFGLSDTCAGVTRVETQLVRFSLFNGTARFIEIENGGEPVLSTEVVEPLAIYPIPELFVAIDAHELDANLRKPKARRISDRLLGAGRRLACFDNSFAFTLSNTCFLDERGPWRGLSVSGGTEMDEGSNYSEYRAVDLDPEAQIDGRFFEWDREITLAPTSPSPD